ncbi:MAG: PQQ-dependent sugar dehydrogenase [Verrucomicrobiota bacterium]
MKFPRLASVLLGLGAIGFFPLQTFASLQRVPNTSLQIPASPPEFAFAWTNALNGMNFTNPVCILSPPGETNRLFILEKQGRVVVITNLANPTKTIFMDIRSVVNSGAETSYGGESGLLGMAFHPGYSTNRYFYLWYTRNTTPRLDTLSRFTTSASDPNQGVTSSELRMLSQADDESNHNGGDLHFGPIDGYLYLSLGDEGGMFGEWGNCQLIDKDFFASVLRIDVDKLPGNLPPNPHASVPTNVNGEAYYSIPVDNPFVHTSLGGSWDGNFNGSPIANLTKVRSEFWAVGFRHPFRFSFAPGTGTLYLGDVGEQNREEIDIVEPGKNYGWNYYEGSQRFTSNFTVVPPGFVHALPLHEYASSDPAEKWAAIGGNIYTGQRLSQLYGAYIFGDYGQGYIWAMRHTGTNVTELTQLVRDDFNTIGIAAITTFGIDPSNGDILYGDAQNGTNGRVKRIIYSTNAAPNAPPIPPTLADTGAFANLSTLTPNPGVVPYDLNVPFWSDNAIKTRWFSVPNTNLTIGFDPAGNWSFPTGTVWIKHFELELTNGVSASRKRLETRLLTKNASGVYGATYRWGNSLTNATLVPEEGLDESFVINQGGGILRTQLWHYPSRSQCLQCHTEQGGFALGFNTPQLNRIFDHSGTVTNQISALNQAGYFSSNATNIHTLPALANATNSSVSLEYRVRSYLAANCAQCHQGNFGQALWDARLATPTALCDIIDGAVVNDFGNGNNRVVKPGSLANSVLHSRISNLGGDRMPPAGSTILDTQAIALLSAWITNDLPNYKNFATWQSSISWTNVAENSPLSDHDHDGAVNYLEYLTGTDPLQSASFWRVNIRRAGANVEIVFPQKANRAFEVQYTDDLAAPILWKPLDTSANAPFFSAIDGEKTLVDSSSPNQTRFYRVRVSEP